MDKQFFHEIDPAVFGAMKDRGATWTDVKAEYLAPPWCGYGEDALGRAGCWSLVGGRIRCRDNCKGCDAVVAESSAELAAEPLSANTPRNPSQTLTPQRAQPAPHRPSHKTASRVN